MEVEDPLRTQPYVLGDGDGAYASPSTTWSAAPCWTLAPACWAHTAQVCSSAATGASAGQNATRRLLPVLLSNGRASTLPPVPAMEYWSLPLLVIRALITGVEPDPS